MHVAVREFLERTEDTLVISPFVLAEVDYLVGRLCGFDAALVILDDVANAQFALEVMTAEDVGSCRDIVERYRDLHIGLADASNVVLAHRYRTNNLLTFDQRHFGAMRTLDGQPFVILPADDE